jgi:SAM-dependent methyltransferase
MTRIEKFYWHRQPTIDEALLREFADCLGPGKLVVDVGAGYDPWPYATEFVDREAWPQIVATGKPLHVLDVELDRLPYADKSVDFLYCRHTIEDLHNPTLLLREINRVAKAGYVETPSPIAELSRNVDGQETRYRGFCHHHWFCWSDKSHLILLPKYPAIESPSQAEDAERFFAMVESRLDADTANTRVLWRGRLPFRVLAHRVDFDLAKEGTYESKLIAGVESVLTPRS